MNVSTPLDNNEANLFEFHFSSVSNCQAFQDFDKVQPSIFQQSSEPFYSYYSDSIPNSNTDAPAFSSPQLKPTASPLLTRKRVKTLVNSTDKTSLFSPASQPKNNIQEKIEHESKKEENDADDDDAGSESDSDSNQGSVESNNKRGKYKIYTEQEKSTILNFLRNFKMMKHGIQKTLEIFSGNTHKITKRKLKSWLEGQNKIKGVKGRKTNDPNRDQTLHEWCLAFQREYGRAPTRKEATKQALELSEDPSFQASKGWLDKFSKKFNIEFTPLKVIPPKNKKKLDGFFLDSDSGSTVSNSDSCGEGISPLLQAMQTMQLQQPQEELKLKPWALDNNVNLQPCDKEYEAQENKINSFFNFSNTNNGFEPLSFDKKEVIMPPIMEQQPYYPQQVYGNQNFYNYTYPGTYQAPYQQPPYQMNGQINQEQSFQMNYFVQHQQQQMQLQQQQHQQQHQQQQQQQQQGQYDVNRFLNSGMSYEADRFVDSQTKMEHPY